MQFTDFVFLFLLLPIGCTLFYHLTARFGASPGIVLLLCVSLLFYSTWGNRYLALLVCSFSVNFAAACTLLVAPDNRRTLRRTTLYLGQAYNFGTLLWFKYRFIALVFSATSQSFTLLDAAIPVGISFYTFQQAILLVDAYHRDASMLAYLGDMRTLLGKTRGYLRHAFFVAFFPHLIIGPIVYLSEFQPQVASPGFGRAKRTQLAYSRSYRRFDPNYVGMKRTNFVSEIRVPGDPCLLRETPSYIQTMQEARNCARNRETDLASFFRALAVH